MLQNYWKFQSLKVQTYGFVYQSKTGQNQGPVWKIQSFLLSEIFMVILWQQRQFEKILLQHGWEKVSNCECLFVHREKGLFLSVHVDDIKLAGKKQNIDPMWKELNKEVDLGEPTSFFDHVYLGCTQRQCEISKVFVDNYRTMFESRISAGWNWKTTMLGKSSYFFVVLRCGGSCQEMCGTILWVGKQDDSTTLQSIYSLHRWPPLQRRRNEICWRIVTSMLSNCSEMLILGTNWKAWYSMVRDYFKILILPVTWKIQNQHRVESYSFSEVTRSCQKVGCARNRYCWDTFSWCGLWMVSQLWVFGIWYKKCSILPKTNPIKPWIR